MLLTLLALALWASLSRPCDVTVGWRQPQDVVLLCRGVEPVRLWPWPVQGRYWEDPEIGGQIG